MTILATAQPELLLLFNRYTADLEKYGGDMAAAIASLPNAGADGGQIKVRRGDYTRSATSTISVPVEIEGQGEGASIFIAPAGGTFPLLDIVGASAKIRGMGFEKASGAALSGNGHAIRVSGAVADLEIENVRGDGFVNTVLLQGNASGSAASQVFSVKLPSVVSGGTWKLGVQPLTPSDVQWATGLAWNVSAGALQSALEALSAIGVGNVAVTGGPAPAAYTLTFQGTLAGLHMRPILFDGGALTGGNAFVVGTETIRGGGPWITRATLRQVVALNSPSSWGIGVDLVDDLTLDRCAGRGNWLDGLKMRLRVTNWKVLGGDYSSNGQGWLSNATVYAGDGMDCYAGGESGLVDGTTFNDNAGNGFLAKNDDGSVLSGYGSGKYGLTRKLDLANVQACRNLVGNGIALTQNSGTGSYAVTNVTITGGLFDDNATDGVLIQARNVVVQGAKATRNRLRGFHVHPDATDVDLIGIQAIANGSGAGTGIGIQISGKRVTVLGGRVLGAWSDGVTLVTDLATLTKYHLTNIQIAASATDVLIRDVDERDNSSGRGIAAAAGAVRVFIHQRVGGGLVPGSSLLYGSPGSTVMKTDATDPSDMLWLKIAGEVAATGSWRRLGARGVASKSAAYTTLAHDDLVNVTAGATDKTITLVTAVGNKGIEQTIVRVDGAAGNVIVDANASETILTAGGAAALTKTLGTQGSSLRVVSDGANWIGLPKEQ